MNRLALASLAFVCAATVCTNAHAQAASGDKSEKVLLEALSKKIDEQNAKIDILSQQILKLEQQVVKVRPGVIIGETPSPTATHSASTDAPKATPVPQSGNSHVVAKGETLTSIAKMHKVSVDELKKFNRIENDRTLQIGQTIQIPSAASSPGASPTASPAGG
ncbi:MAG TPA: LysM peptidoglycan-binding domain-containing protein [Chthoniobacterales bacterium]|nr:LysM peptidoglycan-binding domain-containing protein [Chthoniobacterales bacterium]